MINRRNIVAGGAVAAVPAAASATASSVQERNKAVIRSYFLRCWNQGDLDFAKTIMIPDYDLHLADGPGGYAAWRAGVAAVRQAIPDLRFDNLAFIAEGDLVAVRSVWTGTHKGDFFGIAPTGRRFTARNADFYQLRDGKMVRHWDVPDFFSILLQLGGLPADTADRYAALARPMPWPADAAKP